MKGYHALGIGAAIAVVAYLAYKNYQMFIGGVANQAMGGFDFGVLDPTTGWDASDSS